MGGKSKGSNNAQLQFEMQQAQEARDQENARQARLTSGKQAIDDIFAGGGFDDAFYKKYHDADLQNNTDQLSAQYAKNLQDTKYALQRAGTYRSTVANQALDLLNRQNAIQQESFNTQADTDTAAVRSGILGQQQSAYNQLYATEDPGVAANAATSAVQQGQAITPNLQPLGELFKPLVIGSLQTGATLGGIYNANNVLNNPNAGLNVRSPTGSGSFTEVA
jgi:phage-related protein